MIQARDVIIVSATAEHVRAMRDRLRDDDRREVEAAGLSCGRALWRSWRGSYLVRTAFVNDDIAAMWGLGGCPLGGMGTPWLLTTPAAERARMAFVREGRHEIAEMLTIAPVLSGFVDSAYHRAIRLLEVLGFTVEDPLPVGPTGALFRRYVLERPY